MSSQTQCTIITIPKKINVHIKVETYLPATGCRGEIVLILISEQLVSTPPLPPLLLVVLGTGDSLLLKEAGRGSEEGEQEVVVGTAVRSDMSIISMLDIARYYTIILS